MTLILSFVSEDATKAHAGKDDVHGDSQNESKTKVRRAN